MANAYSKDSNNPTDDILNSQGQGSGNLIAPFDFQKKQVALELRKARLAQLMREQMGYEAPQGQMLRGGGGGSGGNNLIGSTVYNQPNRYVAPSALEYIAAIAKPLLNRYAQNQESEALGADQAEFDAADRRAAIAHAMSAPRGTPETRQANPIPDYEGNSMPDVVTPGIAPTTQERILHAQQGLGIPSRRAVLEKVIQDLEVNEPTRIEARSEKNKDREDRQVEASKKLIADQQLRRELAQDKIAQEERESKREERLRRDLADNTNQLRRDLIAQQINNKSVLKPLADSTLKDLNEQRAQARIASGLAGSFKDSYAGYGAAAQDNLSNITGIRSEANDWWSDYRAKFENPERKALLGAVLSKTDLTLWDKSTISPKMDAAKIRENLATREAILHNNFIDRLDEQQRNGKDAYEVFGYDRPPSRRDIGPPKPAVNPVPNRKEIPAGAPLSGKQRAVKINSKAEYDKLDSGAVYIAPDGSVRTKP